MSDMVTDASEGQDPAPVSGTVDPGVPEDNETAAKRRYLDDLAVRVMNAYKVNEALTINILASQLNATVQDVTEVIDEYQVLENNVVFAGTGQGHGWVTPATMTVAEAEHIGYRWPDGSLRADAFDLENPEHREEMGIQL